MHHKPSVSCPFLIRALRFLVVPAPVTCAAHGTTRTFFSVSLSWISATGELLGGDVAATVSQCFPASSSYVGGISDPVGSGLGAESLSLLRRGGGAGNPNCQSSLLWMNSSLHSMPTSFLGVGLVETSSSSGSDARIVDRLGEEARFATAAVAWLSSITTKETFLEDRPLSNSMTSSLTDVAAGEWGSLSVLVQAIETANPTEPEAVTEVLRDIHVVRRSCVRREWTGLSIEVPIQEWSRESFPLQTGWKENATQTRCHSMERAGVCSLCAIGDISVLTSQLDECGSVRRTCQGCDIGRYAPSSQNDTGAVYFCNDCETGRYMNLTGVSACLYCPTGTIADETASTTCRACAPGSSTATLGTVICNNCSVGSYQKVSGQTSCVSCNAGFFVPSIGQTVCQACEPGFCQRPRGSESMLLLFLRLYSSLYNKTSLSRFCLSRSDVGHRRWPGFRRHGATHRVSLNLGTCCFSMLASWPQVSAVCPPAITGASGVSPSRCSSSISYLTNSSE